MAGVVAPKPQRRLPREERRAHLLDAAASLVVSDGLAAVTVERLAERAGVSRGLVYVYFTSAEDVLVALHDREAEEVDALMRAATASAGPALADQIRAAANAWLDWSSARGPLIAPLFTAQSPEALRRRQRQRTADGAAYWAELFHLASGKGGDVVLDLADMAQAAFLAVLQRWADGQPRARLVEAYVEFVVGGLERATGQGRAPSTANIRRNRQ